MASSDSWRPELHIRAEEKQLSLILEEALRLLEEYGMQCRSREAKDLLKGSFGGSVCSDDRITFAREDVREYIDAFRSWNLAQQEKTGEQQGFSMNQSWSCLQLADAARGVHRTAGEEDVVRIIRFLDAFDVSGAVSPVVLGDCPVHLRDLKATALCLKHSPVYGAPTHTPDEQELAYYKAMAQAAGKRIPILAMLVNSPMRYDDRVLDFVNANLSSPELIIELTGGLPCAGSTSALTFPASAIQTVAESLAASLFAYAAAGVFLEPYLRNDPFDMRYGNYTIAGPVYALQDQIGRKMTEYITGAKRSWGYFLSMSPWPDQQAAYERTVSCWLQALSGARIFHGSGQLCSDEVYSPEQVVIDREILRSCERFISGAEWDDNIEAARTVLKEGLDRGEFLDHESTLEHFRSWQYDSRLFPARNLGQWKNAEQNVLIRAAAVIEETLQKNTFSRPPEVLREIDGIYTAAETRG
jgi:trimethylamine:corrinoid methyltransferase-like protein